MNFNINNQTVILGGGAQPQPNHNQNYKDADQQYNGYY